MKTALKNAIISRRGMYAIIATSFLCFTLMFTFQTAVPFAGLTAILGLYLYASYGNN